MKPLKSSKIKSFKSIKRNSSSCICKIEGKHLYEFDARVFCRSPTLLLLKPVRRDAFSTYLDLELLIRDMIREVDTDAEELCSVVVDADKGKVIRVRLNEETPLALAAGQNYTVTLRLMGVKLTHVMSEVIWEFVSIAEAAPAGGFPEVSDEEEDVEEGGEEVDLESVVEDLKTDLALQIDKRIQSQLARLEEYKKYKEVLGKSKAADLELIERISQEISGT